MIIKKHLKQLKRNFFIYRQQANKRRIRGRHGFPAKEYRQQFQDFQTDLQQSGRDMQMTWQERYPILNERTAQTHFDRHYVYHTGWAARILAEQKTAKHVDIGSQLYFISIASAFVPIQFYDYRPAELIFSNLKSEHADLTQLPFADDSIASLSCMHVVEHIGLGRYGDTLDANGDLKAMRELTRVLAPNGQLLFVVPVGQPKVIFNAHRIYDPVWLGQFFVDMGLRLEEFSVVPDGSHLERDRDPAHYTSQNYACGMYHLRK